jgi:hypothetical protein
MSEEPMLDNVESAMKKVAETIKPTRKANTNPEDGGTATKQVLIRLSEEDHLRWKEASDKEQLTMSDFIRKAVNAASSDVLDCKHPRESVQWYPWGIKCRRCGSKLDNVSTS